GAESGVSLVGRGRGKGTEMYDVSPAKRVEQLTDLRLRASIIAADKQGVRVRQLAGIYHELAIDRVQRLDDLGAWKGVLKLFAERFRSRPLRREHVGHVDDRLAVEIRSARRPQCGQGACALCAVEDQRSEGSCV